MLSVSPRVCPLYVYTGVVTTIGVGVAVGEGVNACVGEGLAEAVCCAPVLFVGVRCARPTQAATPPTRATPPRAAAPVSTVRRVRPGFAPSGPGAGACQAGSGDDGVSGTEGAASRSVGSA